MDLSVEKGVWATQPHNEPVLDQAYRTSQDVFLIFGANKSGEFFGYARLVSFFFSFSACPLLSFGDLHFHLVSSFSFKFN